MRKLVFRALALALPAALAACGVGAAAPQAGRGAAQTGRAVSVMGTWGGTEGEAFRAAVEPFTQRTGVRMAFEVTPDLNTVLFTRVEAGNPPDLAILPGPNQLRELAETGRLVPLERFMDRAALRQNYGQTWLDLGSAGGQLYGLWFKGATKSLVWYSPRAFRARGYQPPTTWAELTALTQRMADSGTPPWCVGLMSGSSSGWPGTDWLEDLMLRSAGPQVYDQWVSHQIAWTDPQVRRAWELWGQLVRDPRMVWGGPVGTLTTAFGDAPRPLFSDPPGCFLHKQASFVTSFFPEGLAAGQDYDFFVLPAMQDGAEPPALVAGDVVVMLRDTPQARQLMQYLASPQPSEIWAARGGFISPNRSVSLGSYPDDLTRRQAQFTTGAQVLRFDGSDSMPSVIGAGSFWQGVLNYASGQDLDTVLQRIEGVEQQIQDRTTTRRGGGAGVAAAPRELFLPLGRM